MSAFEVSDKHINTLVCWAKIHKVRLYAKESGTIEYADAAQILRDANTKSVAERYRGDAEGGKIEFRDVADVVWGKISPIAIVKACHCLDYQSCEYDGWQDSEAKSILNQIEASAVRCVPGYDKAPWSID